MVRQLLALAVVAGGILAAREQEVPPSREQTFFREDEPLQRPVTMSPDVLKVLLETKEAKLGLELAKGSAEENPARLFRAAEVHLNSEVEVDLVVIGIPPMSGADNGWFWVVRSVREGPKVVLFAGGNALELMRSRTNGYRDIRSTWSTPSETRDTLYRFDRQIYKLWKKTYRPNR